MVKNKPNQPNLFDTQPPKKVTEKPVIVTKEAPNVTNILENESINDWWMRRWKEFAVPGWRRALREAVESGNKRREKYARWILKEVLEVKDESSLSPKG